MVHKNCIGMENIFFCQSLVIKLLYIMLLFPIKMLHHSLLTKNVTKMFG